MRRTLSFHFLSSSLVAVALVSAACKDSASGGATPAAHTAGKEPATAKEKDEPEPKKSAGFDDLKATIDGKPMKVEHAFVKRQPGEKLQLYVGEGGSCNQMMGGLYDGKMEHVLLDLPARLGSDGKLTYEVDDVWLGPPTNADPGSSARVKGELGKKGAPIELQLSFTAKGGGDEKLAMKGSFTAESCGDQDVSEGPLPKAKHASTATMTLAGKKISIKAALLHGDELELTDFPRDCIAAWFIGARLVRKYDKWHLDGSMFSKEIEGDEDKALVVKKGASGKSDDGPTIELTLSGEGKVGDYPVTIDGMIEALDCK